MEARKLLMTGAAVCLSASAVYAEDSSLMLGEMTYGALCAVCHGDVAEGGGEVGDLFDVKPPKLTNIAERAGGRFPFSDVYHTIIRGMEAPGHGRADMPIWGDYFMADALVDRGVSKTEAMYVASGRAMSVALYLESIQE